MLIPSFSTPPHRLSPPRSRSRLRRASFRGQSSPCHPQRDEGTEKGALLSGEKVLLYYRTRFQIEFCFRDVKGYTGLMDCQARDKWKLDFAFNASFTSLNVAKVTMKEMGMEYSMSSFKSLMTNIYLVKRIFKASGYTPNRTLISKIFKDLSRLQRIAA